MRPTAALRPCVLVSACAIVAGCSYDDANVVDPIDTGTSVDVDTEDIVEDDTSVDEDATTVDDVSGGDAGPTLPEYVATSCSERTPVAGEAVISPPSCDYEVSYPFGIVDITESCGAATDAPTQLHLTFPSADAGSAMAVLWQTPDTTRESVVQLGDSPDALDRTYWGHNFTYPGLNEAVVHEVHLCGLEPGRTYYYRAGGEGAWSDVHSFSTAPSPDSDEEIVFAVTGDSRSDTFEIWGDAVQQMRDKGAEFIVFSGDAVDSGPIQVQWDRFFTQGQPGLAEMPLLPCNGNHDALVATWYGQLALPGDEVNFPVRYGPLAFVSMTDTYPPDLLAPYTQFGAILDGFLEEHADAAWKFLVNHKPLYSASTRHGSDDNLRDAWGPAIDEHEVDLVFNGHDHNYERSRPIRAEEVVPFGEGTLYSVIAGVGAPLYDNGAQWWTETSEKVGAYAIIRVTPDQLDFTAYRVDGTELDSFTWQR